MVTAVNMAAISGEYRTEFNITGLEEPEAPLYRRVCNHVQDWFDRLPNDAEPVVESDEFEELACRRFQIELPHSLNRDYRLGLEVKLATSGGAVSVRVETRFLETETKAPPPNLLAGPPSVIRELFGIFDCRLGGDILSVMPTVVTTETAESFANGRVLNPQRTLPIVAVSQDWRDQTSVSPGWLQTHLAGQAEVATYDGDTAEELIRYLGPNLACYNGAVRVYQPGCTFDDSRRSYHRFWMPSDARSLQQHMPRLRLQTLTQCFPERTDTREYEIVRRQARQARDVGHAVEAVAVPLRRRLQEQEAEIRELREQLEFPEEETAENRMALHGLRQQLLELDAEIESLRTELDIALGQAGTVAEEIGNLHQQQVERDRRIEAMWQRLQTAIAEADAAVTETSQIHSRLLENDHQIEALRQRLEGTLKGMAAREREVADAHQRLKERDREIEQCHQEMEEVSASPGVSGRTVELAIEQLRSHLNERAREFAQLRQMVTSAAMGSEDISNMVSEFRAGLSLRDADIATLSRLVTSVDQGVDANESIGAELRREMEEREKDLEAMRSRLAVLDRRQQGYESAISELLGEEEERQEEMAAITSLLDESRQQAIEPDARVTQLEQDLEASEQLLQEESGRRRIAEDKVQILEGQIQQRDERIRDLSAINSQLSIALASERDSDVFEWPEEPLELANIYEAVETASHRFERLRFLPSAYKSAHNYPFQPSHQVYEAFSLLQELAVARGLGPLGMSVEDWFKAKMDRMDFEYAARESEPTMQRYGPTRVFQGMEMQEHIKIGTGTANRQRYLRIHFTWGEKENKYIIGHVGEHLPIVSGR